jgi:hypothetical protein
MIYKTALRGGWAPASIGKAYTVAQERQTLYVSFTLKLSSNFQAHISGVNKKLHFFTAGGSNRAVFIIRGSGSGTLVPAFLLQRLGIPMTYTTFGERQTTSTEQNLNSNPAVCKTIRGQWHHYELILTDNTPGVANGRAQIWMDGVNCLDVSGIGFAASGQNGKWEDIWWSPTWGGIQDAVAAEFTETVDHIYVSGK